MLLPFYSKKKEEKTIVLMLNCRTVVFLSLSQQNSERLDPYPVEADKQGCMAVV